MQLRTRFTVNDVSNATQAKPVVEGEGMVWRSGYAGRLNNCQCVQEGSCYDNLKIASLRPSSFCIRIELALRMPQVKRQCLQ